VAAALARLRPFAEDGLVVLDSQGSEGRRIRLSCPDGFLMSNSVLVELFREEK
jgi:hypothetical protein